MFQPLLITYHVRLQDGVVYILFMRMSPYFNGIVELQMRVNVTLLAHFLTIQLL